MLMKRPKPKEFDYIPRYYDPEKDPEERLRRRLGFQRKRRHKVKGRSPIFWLVLLLIVIYLYLKFSGAV